MLSRVTIRAPLRANPLARFAAPSTTTAPFARRRWLQSSAMRRALKETRDQDGIEHKIEHHKQDQLKKKEEGKNQWTEELASDSESAVKADRGETNADADHIEQLQKQTVDRIHKG
ncbi:MAG: hypothetical protein M1826_002239 [Phylliscum demangeonii]|nr:MAG: hypothetical protein M1826_002239 [Phylliscum demangeonii]